MNQKNITDGFFVVTTRSNLLFVEIGKDGQFEISRMIDPFGRYEKGHNLLIGNSLLFTLEFGLFCLEDTIPSSIQKWKKEDGELSEICSVTPSTGALAAAFPISMAEESLRFRKHPNLEELDKRAIRTTGSFIPSLDMLQDSVHLGDKFVSKIWEKSRGNGF